MQISFKIYFKSLKGLLPKLKIKKVRHVRSDSCHFLDNSCMKNNTSKIKQITAHTGLIQVLQVREANIQLYPIIVYSTHSHIAELYISQSNIFKCQFLILSHPQQIIRNVPA